MVIDESLLDLDSLLLAREMGYTGAALKACKGQSQSLLMWAAMVADEGGDDTKQAISSIKYHVSSAGRKLGEEAVQLHGGMGVTWELDVAHYFKRLVAIGQTFGNADWHLDRLAAS